ncbi:MAG: NifU family protein [Nitrospiraceae bacterium]|nr:NifU family protein [Nitrospiraceae bacterium]
MQNNVLKDKVEVALEKIREGLRSEGGDIELVRVEGGIVYVKLKGACEGCPMSMLTMKNWVEAVLKKELPEISGVKAA